jgi:hypothetical protein
MDLPVDAYGGYTPTARSSAPTVLAHGNKKIGLLPGQQLCALLAFYHHVCAMEKRLMDVFDLTKEGFDIFWMSLYVPQDPVVPMERFYSRVRTTTCLCGWQKSVKIDPKA